ncbi:hypothetical protein OCU04_012553 [Sclerotinia nivalis]|uniref:Uncharacterized protein n=1 Tax=Sclerotinia nivalis TaxID=352851 RepID=A0A9X0A8Z4_9HELO|nr:hypothetical protein OCU04_012553 [Sclerotinia nivalis]
MSTSLRPGTLHYVRFGTNVTNPSGKELQVILNPVNKECYHRTVDSEKKLWIQANVEAQIEVDVSDGKQSYSKIMLQRLLAKAMHLKSSYGTKETFKHRRGRKY